MLATLTGLGLSAAAGLNAYIPVVLVAALAKFTGALTLPESFAWLENPWVFGGLVLLLISEAFLDKIPAVDSVNDAVGTLIRPASGGVTFAATTAAQDLESNTTLLSDRPWLAVLLGVITAGLVHAGKATTRPVMNVATLGVSAPVISTAEDGFSFTLSLAAIFIPLLVIVLLGLMIGAGVWIVMRVRRRNSV